MSKCCHNTLFLFIIFSFVATGCGIQMPVTEGLVFSSHEVYGTQLGQVRMAAKVAGGSRIISSSDLRAATVEEHGSSEAKYLNTRYLSASGLPAFAFSLWKNRW